MHMGIGGGGSRPSILLGFVMGLSRVSGSRFNVSGSRQWLLAPWGETKHSIDPFKYLNPQALLREFYFSITSQLVALT